MKLAIRERDRRALIGLVLAGAVYVLLSIFVLPAFDALRGTAAEAADKEQQLRKYRRAMVRKGHYAGLLEQARRNSGDVEARLIPGNNPSLASVELQTIVEQAAEHVGISLSQRNMSVPKKKDDFFNEITMTLSFESTPNQLMMFLSEIRTAPRFIGVRNAQVSPLQVVHEAPKGEFKKLVKVSVTLGAILASPRKAGA